MSEVEQQQQRPPGRVGPMEPAPDHGEESYEGHGRLTGKAALITGADSGIGRAVAIAFAREGADVLISYLEEDDDARATAEWVERAGQRAELCPGDIAEASHCRSLVSRTVDAFGRIDVLVNNAAFQRTYEQLEDVPDDEWDRHWRTNVSAMFYLCKASLPHMQRGASIVNTASVNADQPKPSLLPYASTKGAIVNFSAALAELLGPRGIRVNSVLPGPVWTPLIPSTMPADEVEGFGSQTPLGRPAQPAELAPVYVLLASAEASYISGAAVAVTGGNPVI